MSKSVVFQRCDSSAVRSIRQKVLLREWIRAWQRSCVPPSIEEFEPPALADERADLAWLKVVPGDPPRFFIEKSGQRLSAAFTVDPKGRYLDEFLDAKMIPVTLPVYQQCVTARLPVFTIAETYDVQGIPVAHERLLLPLSEGREITHIVASMKPISEEGRFEVRSLMRSEAVHTDFITCAVIDPGLAGPAAPTGDTDDGLEI